MMRTSPAVQASLARIVRAEGITRQVLARSLPKLGTTGSLVRHLLLGRGISFGVNGAETGALPNPALAWNARVGIAIPLLAPRAWFDAGTSSEAEAAARLSSWATERVATTALADAIAAVVTAERLADVSRVSLRSALAVLELNRKKVRLESGTMLDVLRAEQEVSQSRAQVIAAKESVQRAREALGTSLGTEGEWGLAPSFSIDDLEAQAALTCRRTGGGERDDVAAARANVRVAERRVRSANLSLLPTVDGTSELTYWSDDQFSPNGRPVTWTAGLTLTWLLFDGGARRGEARQAAGEVEEIRQQLADTQRNARVAIERTARDVGVAQAALEVGVRARAIAADTARLTTLAFAQGSGTSFELLETTRHLREAELDLVVKEYDVVHARLAALLETAQCRL